MRLQANMPVRRRVCPTQEQLRTAQFRKKIVKMANSEHPSVTRIDYRQKDDDDWIPWTIVAPSALLRLLNPPVYADGLYAARRFEKYDFVGAYPRTRKWSYKGRSDKRLISRARRMVLHENIDTLITAKKHPKGVWLVDGTGGGGPEVQKANDPKGTLPKRQPNAIITEGGMMQVIGTNVATFNMSMSIEDNINSELRIKYGDDFWRLFNMKGKPDDQQDNDSDDEDESDDQQDNDDEDDQQDNDSDDAVDDELTESEDDQQDNEAFDEDDGDDGDNEDDGDDGDDEDDLVMGQITQRYLDNRKLLNNT